MVRSLALLPAFAAVAFGQGAPIAQTTTPDQPAVTGCGGCYIIADVAQVIFADYTSTQTATAVASQGTGRNGTVVTQTVFSQALPPFSFNSAGLLNGSPVTGAYIPLSGTVVTIGGAALTSPTAYNVFTAYTQFQLTQVGGACSTQTLPVVAVNPASTVTLGANADASALFAAEQSFVDSIPRLSCAVGGAVVSTTIPVAVTTTTTTSTTSGIYRPTLSQPIPETQAGSSTSAAAATAAASSTSDSGIVISMNPSASGSSGPSVVQGAASTLSIHFSTTSAVVLAALFALPGFGAWVL